MAVRRLTFPKTLTSSDASRGCWVDREMHEAFLYPTIVERDPENAQTINAPAQRSAIIIPAQDESDGRRYDFEYEITPRVGRVDDKILDGEGWRIWRRHKSVVGGTRVLFRWPEDIYDYRLLIKIVNEEGKEKKEMVKVRADLFPLKKRFHLRFMTNDQDRLFRVFPSPGFEIPNRVTRPVADYHRKRVRSTCLEFHLNPTNNIPSFLLNMMRFCSVNDATIFGALSDGTMNYFDFETGISESIRHRNANGSQGSSSSRMIYGLDINSEKELALVADNFGFPYMSEKNYRSVKNYLTSSASSSPVRERASMGISAVKSLVLREKEEKVASEFSDGEAWALIQSILDAEGLALSRKVGFSGESLPSTMSFPRDIRGAPPQTAQSLIVKISEVMGSFKTLRKMALFWCRFIVELRRLWFEEKDIPEIPRDEIPDLSYCPLYQQLQLMNCCLSRKRRRVIATDSLESLMREADCDGDGVPSSIERITSGSFPYAKTSNGQIVVRLGVSHQADNLSLLETGEPVYAPLAQEGQLLTEDLARETEEFVLRTGSVGAGCSQLLSDMQAFKAANPGCILEDFVRWHSPDWTENDSGNESDVSVGASQSMSSIGD